LVPTDFVPDSSLTESYLAAINGFNFLELGGDPEPKSYYRPSSEGSTASGQLGGYTETTDMSFDTLDFGRDLGEEVQNAPVAQVPEKRESSKEAACTTLMIRNIPRKYTQRQLLIDLIAAHDFSGRVDFFYLPIDLGTGRNLGYCFLNFVCPRAAAAVKGALHKLRLFAGAKSGLSIGYADVQGLEENVRNVRRSLMHRIKNREYRPLVADENGELVPVTN
jgi:hypothetical protein